ncbi:hypothetical protein FTUN_8752 [Frigoriglobus tundricola]|uniref:Uncharacterized protein n=1 Tax=Frigoriglobus tundricola TaxID=2774151 RepID=A0A6M5Z7D0_9BACT|nr:hypothetical protein FTUN_8752 [Frigoriglobus tundricola]
MSPTEDARPNREEAARGGRGAASSFWPPKGRRNCRRDRGPPGGGYMPCEFRKVTLPSDVSRRAKVTSNWGSPSGRRVGNPGPGRVSRGQAEGRERAASRSRGSERVCCKAVARPSGPPGWCRETYSDESGDERLRSMFAGRPGLVLQPRPTPGYGRGVGAAGTVWNAVIRTVRRRDDDGRPGCTRGPGSGYEPLRPYLGTDNRGKRGAHGRTPCLSGRTPRAGTLARVRRQSPTHRRDEGRKVRRRRGGNRLCHRSR